MIPLKKRPNSPYWVADLRSVGLGRVSTKRTNKKEAAAVAEEMRRRALDRDQLGARDELSLKAALDRYIMTLDNPSYAKDRARLRDKLLGLGVWANRPTFSWSSDILVSEITTAMISDLQARRRAEGRYPAAINHETKMLQRTYRLCMNEWDVNVRPGVRFPILRVKSKKRRLTDEEETKLLTELDPTRPLKSVPSDPTNPRRLQMQDAYDLTVFLIDTGCRCGEAASVLWDRVSLQEDTVTFYRKKVDNEGLVGLTPRLKEILMRRRSMYPGARYVFPRWDKQRVDGRRARGGAMAMRAVSKAIERAGLNDDEDLVAQYGKLTPHSFRDTFCSRLLERGLSTAGAQDLLGHATPSMTKKYAHLASRDLAKKAAELLS